MSKTSKRKISDPASAVDDFIIIETVHTNDKKVVELVPTTWIKTIGKNRPIKVREAAKCFYPLRSDAQTESDYLQIVRHAKFDCTKPKNDKNWIQLDCKILKLGIGSFDEAVSAEKFFGDFFKTNDTEPEVATAKQPVKRLRKPRKSKTNDAKSDDANIVDIPDVIQNYNSIFKGEGLLLATERTTENNESPASIDGKMISERETFKLPERNASNSSIDEEQIDDITTPENDKPEIVIEENFEHEIAEEVVFEFIDQQQSKTSSTKCNCMQKVMNRLDYIQKKFSKDIGRYRQETLQAIRQINDRVEVLQSKDFDTPDVGDQIQNEDFENFFKSNFPVECKASLTNINEKLFTDRNFKRRLTAKLKFISKEEKTNEVKLVRVLLKAMCSSACLSEFSWCGTDKKEKFLALESLIEVIVVVIENQFPGCDGFKTLKGVVQQRTKSAAEFESKKKCTTTTNAADTQNSVKHLVDIVSPSGAGEPQHNQI